MPKKPKFIHPLRAIRNTIGESQPAFAANVGCSAASIQAIENGIYDLTENLAAKIRLHTGASPQELMKGLKGKAVTVGNGPYTKSFYLDWKKKQSRSISASGIESILKWTELLLRVAAKPNVNKLPQIHDALADWLEDMRREFKLGPAIDAACHDRKFMATETRTLEQWRIDKINAKWWGFKDSKKFKPGQSITINKEAFIPWGPGSEFPKG